MLGVRYRGTSLIGNTPLLGPCSRTIPRVIWWSYGGVAVSYERGTPAGDDLRRMQREAATQLMRQHLRGCFWKVGEVQGAT